MNQTGKQQNRNCLALKKTAPLLIASALLLAGCAGNSSNVVYDTFKLAISNPNTVIDEAPLNPSYRYLKVDANGIPALLVLGYLDQKKNTVQDVWYSAFKEVVEINEGRLANTEGLDINWTQVVLYDPPPLSEALTANQNLSSKRKPQFRYKRMRTVMPGYHVNIRETVIMRALNETPSDAPKVFESPEGNVDIRWVEETVLVPANNQNPSIKPLRAIYAINSKTNEIVFGKQYLTPDYYVSWLSWPYPKTPSAQSLPKK
jgi:hypothetical protein